MLCVRKELGSFFLAMKKGHKLRRRKRKRKRIGEKEEEEGKRILFFSRVTFHIGMNIQIGTAHQNLYTYCTAVTSDS